MERRDFLKVIFWTLILAFSYDSSRSTRDKIKLENLYQAAVSKLKDFDVVCECGKPLIAFERPAEGKTRMIVVKKHHCLTDYESWSKDGAA